MSEICLKGSTKRENRSWSIPNLGNCLFSSHFIPHGAPLDVFGTLVLPLEWIRVCRELLELQKGCEGPFGSSRG